MTKRIFLRNHRGERLAALLHIPRVRQAIPCGVVICHGFNHNKDERLFTVLGKSLERRGFWVLRFDYSGQGESAGRFEDLSFTKYLGETRLAIDELERRGVGKICLVGHSLGGAVAAWTTSRDKRVAALAVLAPVTRIYESYRRRFAKSETPGFLSVVDIRDRQTILKLPKRFLVDAKRYNLLTAARRIMAPSLVVEAGADERIPAADIRSLRRVIGSQNIRHWTAPHATHVFRSAETQVAEVVTDWLTHLWPTQPKTEIRLWLDTATMNQVTLGLELPHGWRQSTTRTTRSTRDQLLNRIDRFLQRENISLHNLQGIGVVRGPGPFTSVRVGVTVANTLGFANSISVVGLRRRAEETLEHSVIRWRRRPTKPETVIRPYYDRPPNITRPKKNL